MNPVESLVTVAEAVEMTGMSLRTLRRWMKLPTVHVEYRFVKTGTGRAVKTAFLDPATLPSSPGTAEGELPLGQDVGTAAKSVDSFLTAESDLDHALGLAAQMPPGARKPLLAELQRRSGLSTRTLYRRLKQAQQGPRPGRRADTGRYRIPSLAYDVLVAAFITNEPGLSTKAVYWAALQAAPEALTYTTRDGKRRVVSERTAHRIRLDLEADPHTRLLRANEDQLKEYVRTFSGRVTARHANDLWEIDMTRCDVIVCDPESKRLFRPRVHAVIDVFSGCIVGVAFSESEDQMQSDLAIWRSIVRKRGPLGDRWPQFGLPKRLYADNGKTYRSAHFARVLGELGVEVVHSRPRVSHTRGHIERFFRTLHLFEVGLAGYVGQDAADRPKEGIQRLQRVTEKWLQSGGNESSGERFLTITEYQNLFFAWLVAKYHEQVVNGKTRAQHFADTAPAESLVQLDEAELALVFAQRETRTVDAAGRIRLENRLWTVLDGSLAPYQGTKVLVLREPFVLGEDRVVIAWQHRSGRVELIGQAVPAPELADSLEAEEHRKASRERVIAAKRRALAERDALADPRLRFDKQLVAVSALTLPAEVTPQARGRLEAVNPMEPKVEIAADDDLGQLLLAQHESWKRGPDDPKERARWLAQGRPQGRKE